METYLFKNIENENVEKHVNIKKRKIFYKYHNLIQKIQ